MKNLILLLGVLNMCACSNSEIINTSDYNWLVEATRKQLTGCQLIAHDSTRLYTPDGEGNYAALWTRDFCYMVENAWELLPAAEVEAGISYLLAGQRNDGCVPDRVQTDGLAVYSAGPVGNPLGDPPTDNSQFMVKLVYEYVKHTGNIDFFEQNFEKLIAAMNFTQRSENGLVCIDPENPHSPYGFTDTIQKTGELLFSTLLYWEACSQLEILFDKIEMPELMLTFQARCKKIETNISRLWDSDSGMFFAASEDCRQIDIWGNAYAVYIGFPLNSKKDQIISFLQKYFKKYTFNGQIRHLLLPDSWKKTLIPIRPGRYQNGAFWGTATGWVAYALNEKHPELTRQLFSELLETYRTNGIFECVNRDYQQLDNYVVSITNPLGAFHKIQKQPIIN